MKIRLLQLVQDFFGLFGLHIRRLNRNVDLLDAMAEQLRLAGGNISVIIEVGAADGRDSLDYLTRCPKAKLYAYEPLPENFIKLSEAAKSQPRLNPINSAVSTSSGSMDFFKTALADASSLKKPKKTDSTLDKYVSLSDVISVDVVSLADEAQRLNIHAIDILKMDAQGAEMDILRGMESLLSEGVVKVIYTEVGFMEIYHDAPLYHEMASYLSEFRYELHSFYDLVYLPDGRLGWGDAIFVRSV